MDQKPMSSSADKPLKDCVAYEDIQQLRAHFELQVTSDGAYHLLPLIGFLSTNKLLWNGRILCDQLENPSVIVVLVEKYGPLSTRASTDFTGIFVWRIAESTVLNKIKEDCQIITTQEQKFYLKAMEADTWNAIQKLYPSSRFSLTTKASAFMAVLISDTDLKEFQLPDEYYLKELSQSDAADASENWKFASRWAKTRFQGCAEAKLAVGAFTDIDHKLVSWGFVFEDGCIGGLGTAKEHQRKNLAANVVKILCKKICTLQCRPYVFIEDIETSSVPEAFFTKIGFSIIKGSRRYIWGSLHVSNG